MSTSDLREQPLRGYMIGDPLSKGPGYPVTPEGISNKQKHHKSRSRGLASINPKYTLEVRKPKLNERVGVYIVLQTYSPPLLQPFKPLIFQT